MLRTWSYAWWKPVLGVVLGVVWFLLGAALVYAVTAAVWSAFEPGPWVHDFTSSFDVKGNVSPKVLLGTNLALASLIPATWFLIRYVHRMRPRWLASVAAEDAVDLPVRVPGARGGRAVRADPRRRRLLPSSGSAVTPASAAR